MSQSDTSLVYEFSDDDTPEVPSFILNQEAIGSRYMPADRAVDIARNLLLCLALMCLALAAGLELMGVT